MRRTNTKLPPLLPQVVFVFCCQEAHAISQFSSMSPLDHNPDSIRSLKQTRARAAASVLPVTQNL